MKRYRILTTERNADAELTYYDEHRPGLPLMRRQDRWCLDAFGRYWFLPQPRRWLNWLGRRLAER